ncbi:MAG: hypothetical protein WB622_07455 [Acidobacteriaceae bacterium]
MKHILGKALAAATFVFTLNAHAVVRSHAGTVIVDRPADLPEAAQNPTVAMYLHENSAGETALYLEQKQGKTLAVLNVTDPADIRTIAQVALNAPAPFDFVRDLGDNAALIRYRDGSGYALLSFRRTTHPVLTAAPQVTGASVSESLGETALLLQVASAVPQMTRHTAATYNILDLSAPDRLTTLASADHVFQSLARPETGTLFLLNPDGLTVVRRTRVEQQYRNNEVQMDHN